GINPFGLAHRERQNTRRFSRNLRLSPAETRERHTFVRRTLSLRLPPPGAGLRHSEESAGADCGDGVGEKTDSAPAHRRYEHERASEISSQASSFSCHH